MNIFQAIFLGIVQGVSEFLPISSSGHLVIFQKLFAFQEPQILFDTTLHFATLVAILIFFRKKIFDILLKKQFKLMFLIVIGSIPAVIVGLFFKDLIESLFNNLTLVSLALILTGLFNYLADKKLNKNSDKKTHEDLNYKKSFAVGLFQALAIVPGISRSGSTVFAGIMQKIDREEAFNFSFLLSVPAISGATLLQVLDISPAEFSQINLSVFALGAISAFVAGFLSLKFFSYVIKKARLEIFAYYCFILGALSFILSLF